MSLGSFLFLAAADEVLMHRFLTSSRGLYYNIWTAILRAEFYTKFTIITAVIVVISIWMLRDTRKF